MNSRVAAGPPRAPARSPLDPEPDPVGVLVAGILPEALDPVHQLPGEPFRAQLGGQRRVERRHERSVALDQPVARDLPLHDDVLGQIGDPLAVELQRRALAPLQPAKLRRR